MDGQNMSIHIRQRGILLVVTFLILSILAEESVKAASDPIVREAQEKLSAKGYYPWHVDGLFGIRTKKAIEKFQQDSSLPVTGTLDIVTRRELGLSGIAEKYKAHGSSDFD